MKRKHLVIFVFCLALVFTTMSIRAEEPNHFKVYHVKNTTPFEPFEVKLKDQFDKDYKGAVVIQLACFANPVKKTHGKDTHPIGNPDAHLNWYRLKKEVEPVTRTVTFENQFGKQEWKLGEAVYLVVPAQKIEEGSHMPKEFNHFKAYRVKSTVFKPVTVLLYDQWDKEPVKYEVRYPNLFCNPVSKNGEPIYDKDYHLACYLLDRKEPSPGAPKSFDTKDQFGKKRLQPYDSFMLCVPTKKIGWK